MLMVLLCGFQAFSITNSTISMFLIASGLAPVTALYLELCAVSLVVAGVAPVSIHRFCRDEETLGTHRTSLSGLWWGQQRMGIQLITAPATFSTPPRSVLLCPPAPWQPGTLLHSSRHSALLAFPFVFLLFPQSLIPRGLFPFYFEMSRTSQSG